MSPRLSLVVFSHLRWNFVYQRPQHLIARLARSHRVVFVEEPMHDAAREAHIELIDVEPNLVVVRPHTPSPAHGFHADQLAVIKPLLRELFEELAVEDFVAWMYSPLALPLLQDLEDAGHAPEAVIYDCMDELSAFLNAPPELLDREAELFRNADLVFTGGPSLYRAKKERHPSVHCFPSSVDLAHFGQARNVLDEPGDQAAIAGPRLGYHGVIDERIDLPLIERLADAHPEWQIVMVGPVVKIDPATLPRRANIHYFGQKTYNELPAYLAGWDVCIMPFALNEATRFISPTKTLEYMAALKPIVSTPITDVAEPYGNLVHIAGDAKAYITACEAALDESVEERSRRVEGMEQVLAKTSWDRTAAAMESLMLEAVERKREAAETVVDFAPETTLAERPVVIIGAGPTGLSAAYHLGPNTLLLERENRIGGWCRSLEKGGFTFDFAGHIMFSNDPYVHEMYDLLLGDNVHWQDREAWIFSKNVHTRYPFQGALFGLPPDVIKECIVGAIEARFGGAKTPADGKSNGHNGNGQTQKPCNVKPNRLKEREVTDCCGDGIAESAAPLVHANPASNGHAGPKNFEEFIYKVWGAGIAKHFAIPYNRKLWAVPLTEMETSWLGGRVPMPDLEEMIEGALRPVPKPMGPNARFGYPLHGGFQALMDGFLPHISDKLRLNTGVVAVSPSRHTVTLTTGEELEYEALISTMPLPALIRAMGAEAPPQIQHAARQLRHVSVRCVHLGVGREKLTEKHWIYYPEETVFHRIFVQGNASPHCNPPGGFGLTCEITYSPAKPLPCDGDALIERCIEDCRRVGLIGADDLVPVRLECDLPYAYVVYDHERPKNVAILREWLTAHDILLSGRYSEWEYYNSDHAFLAGKKAAERVQELHTHGVIA